MNFTEQYQAKRTTAEKIASLLNSGMVLESELALSAPPAILAAMEKRIMEEGLTGIDYYCSLDVMPLTFFLEPEKVGKVRVISWFSGAYSKKAISRGQIEVLPNDLYDCPRLILGYINPDIFVAAVSPMDKHGYFSFGATADCIETILKKAKHICLEVNENMPRAVNAPIIHISRVDALCENHVPLPVIPPSTPDEVSIAIGNMIAEEVPDGATIQLGIGAIPDVVGMALKSKRHLGIHTEMITDSMIELIECGAVDNSLKPIHTGKSVTTFAFGSKRIYDYIDDNPAVKVLPVAEVNDPAIIARHPNFISVNTGLEIDFYGQVSSESIGTTYISGTGGQLDYVQGAVRSQGGKSFLAFPSTAKNGTISKIKPVLTPGSVVTTSKNDVDYIATEYGIAKLRGKTVSKRAQALISIAHPDFRDELTYAAKKQNIII